MRNFILASTSTVHGSEYLMYIKDEIAKLFNGVSEVIFVPYARPSGLTHDEYTQTAKSFFDKINIKIKGLHEFENPKKAISAAKGIFTGGGNTFLLVKNLYENDLIDIIKDKIENGTPYLGTSAGSNICGQNMKTTNDMPIVYPPSFKTLGIVPFNINPHYLDPDPNSTHKGETRETRILEYLVQNNISVLGIREGNWIRCINKSLTVEGKHTSRVFKPNVTPYEIEPGTDVSNL